MKVLWSFEGCSSPDNVHVTMASEGERAMTVLTDFTAIPIVNASLVNAILLVPPLLNATVLLDNAPALTAPAGNTVTSASVASLVPYPPVNLVENASTTGILSSMD
jgi:hypothetical protein